MRPLSFCHINVKCLSVTTYFSLLASPKHSSNILHASLSLSFSSYSLPSSPSLGGVPLGWTLGHLFFPPPHSKIAMLGQTERAWSLSAKCLSGNKPDDLILPALGSAADERWDIILWYGRFRNKSSEKRNEFPHQSSMRNWYKNDTQTVTKQITESTQRHFNSCLILI